jgi:hypothetical protein
MTMEQDQSIRRELGFGEVFSKTFNLYKRDFAKYFILYAVVGVIVQVSTALAQQAFSVPMLPMNPTPQQASSYFSALLVALLLLIVVVFVVDIIFSSIALGTAIVLASDQITKGQVSLGASIRYSISRLLSIWAVSIIVGIIVGLGLIALIVPGVILAIMYSLALPVLLIEKKGVLESMSRSRQLVGHRWGNSFGIYLVLGIIVIIGSFILSAITGPFGIAGAVANGILSALYQPLFPILLTVYYYSNLARITSPPGGQMWPGQVPPAQAGMKFCTNCGAMLPSTATLCFKCRAVQN